MTTLAPKLPYTHPFAGGYPRLGGQPLPSDPDAIDYLNRVKAADGGVGVEVGVAMAVDDFIKGMKADGIWDALKASCIMCGARTISGALVPLVGTAPTPYNFVAADYDRSGGGLKGDGSTKYLDSNYVVPSEDQNDVHLAVYGTYFGTGSVAGTDLPSQRLFLYSDPSQTIVSVHNNNQTLPSAGSTADGFLGGSRSSSPAYTARTKGVDYAITAASTSTLSTSAYIYAVNRSDALQAAPNDARLAFYSIGSALDLAALDTRVSTLVSAIAAAI